MMLRGRAEGNAIRGRITGRLSLEELCVQTRGGWAFTIRVPNRIGEALSIGDLAEIIVDASGQPKTLRPLKQVPNGSPNRLAGPGPPRSKTPPAKRTGGRKARPG
jgi:hypothetical protein